jgi:hypothetical protein
MWFAIIMSGDSNIVLSCESEQMLLITLVNTIFVTIKFFCVSDIIFYTEFKYVLSFSLSRTVSK